MGICINLKLSYIYCIVLWTKISRLMQNRNSEYLYLFIHDIELISSILSHNLKLLLKCILQTSLSSKKSPLCLWRILPLEVPDGPEPHSASPFFMASSDLMEMLKSFLSRLCGRNDSDMYSSLESFVVAGGSSSKSEMKKIGNKKLKCLITKYYNRKVGIDCSVTNCISCVLNFCCFNLCTYPEGK